LPDPAAQKKEQEEEIHGTIFPPYLPSLSAALVVRGGFYLLTSSPYPSPFFFSFISIFSAYSVVLFFELVPFSFSFSFLFPAVTATSRTRSAAGRADDADLLPSSLLFSPFFFCRAEGSRRIDTMLSLFLSPSLL